jgi:outer membrane lipoprotein SlyB
MKAIITLAGAAAIAVSTFAVPQVSVAQSSRNYGSGDICVAQKRSSANRGTAVGAIAGALLGGTVAGNGAKTEGAVLGAGLGAVAGHQIGKNQVRCVNPPPRAAARYNQNQARNNNCRWVQEYYGGRNHDFEVCRERDGVWRPSGRG